jgi:hypothetical protein
MPERCLGVQAAAPIAVWFRVGDHPLESVLMSGATARRIVGLLTRYHWTSFDDLVRDATTLFLPVYIDTRVTILISHGSSNSRSPSSRRWLICRLRIFCSSVSVLSWRQEAEQSRRGMYLYGDQDLTRSDHSPFMYPRPPDIMSATISRTLGSNDLISF